MDAILSAAWSGLVVGGLYATMAIGLTVIYGVSHVFNFAHGHVAVLGAYVAWLAITSVDVPLGVGIAVAVVVMAVFGWILHQVAIRSLLRRAEWAFATLLFTLGLAILMEWGMLEVFGPRVKSIPVFIEGEADLGPVTVSLNDVALVILAVVIIVALWTFLNRSSLGRAMRAVATSVSGARIVGIDIDRIYGATFALAFGVTAISGVLLGTKSFMTPHIGWEWMIKGFIIVTFGGLGNVPGAIVAALVLGLIETFVTLQLGTLWVWPAWLATFIIALWLRPQGILGGRTA
ncbi:MAG TPA: branched-chain amino acid ABC transporter permease [Candidatus Limnocylindrales bacterium]|nr:branched-chain amino acid ABC transporter permease [Candidatus Limnocylindrales bacterium]